MLHDCNNGEEGYFQNCRLKLQYFGLYLCKYNANLREKRERGRVNTNVNIISLKKVCRDKHGAKKLRSNVNVINTDWVELD